MAVNVDIYRVRSGQGVTQIASDVAPDYTDSNAEDGDQYFLVPHGANQPLVYDAPYTFNTDYTESTNATTITTLG